MCAVVSLTPFPGVHFIRYHHRVAYDILHFRYPLAIPSFNEIKKDASFSVVGAYCDGVNDSLDDDRSSSRYYLRKKAPGQIDHRFKNVRYIGELVKFRVRV